MSKSIAQSAHYFRVAWFRIVKPFIWKHIIQGRTNARRASTFSSNANPLFFNVKHHDTLREKLLNSISKEEILRQADEAQKHHFAFFSNSLREYGEKLHWHKDYASGKEWNASKPASELDFLTSTNGSDVKYAWELNRCHWFTWLGMAYLLDGDKKWATAFKNDVLSWQAANPLGMGINWAMPMEVGIRATNWIFAASFFHEAESLDSAFWQDFMRTLWQHGRFLEYNLEYVRHNANHFMSNAMGLVVLGAYFHTTTDGKRWFLKGKRFVEREIMNQFYSDGVNYEKSTSYHRFVVEMCTIAFASAADINSSFQNQYFERLSKAYFYLYQYSRFDGTAPRIGDTDNGRVLRYSALEDFNNHLKNITLEKSFFPQFFDKIIPIDNTSVITNEKEYSSTYFPLGNYVIWKNRTTHLIVDTGDYGMNGWGGHGHNDCLSFELWLDGQSICIDSGTGAYTSNIELRNALRSTQAHNTVMVENTEQTEYAGLWRIKRDELSPIVQRYEATPQGMTLIAEHSAYAARFGVKHERTFRLEVGANGNASSLTIVDSLIPTSYVNTSLTGTVQYILPSEVQISQKSPTELHCKAGETRLEMICDANFTVEPCQISLFYGDVREGQRITIPCSTKQPTETYITWRNQE